MRKAETALENVRRMTRRWNQRDRRDEAFGRELAESVSRKFRVLKAKEFPTSRVATTLASMLCGIDEQETNEDCLDLLLEWTFERFWGRRIVEYLPIFRKAHERLAAMGYTKKRPLVWGDIDCGAWIEPCEGRSVIALTVYCACRDDNTYVYILNEDTIGSRFHARTAWPRARRSMAGDGWDYVNRGSLCLYRKQGFALQYGDTRDVDYCFTLDTTLGTPMARGAYHKAAEMKWALWNLVGLGQAAEAARAVGFAEPVV